MTVVKTFGTQWEPVAVGRQGTWDLAQQSFTTGVSRTLVAGDAGKLVVVDSTELTWVTVDAATNLLPGQRIDILRAGTGLVTIRPDGVTLNGTPGFGLRARYSMASLLCIAVDEYVLIGDLTVGAVFPPDLSPALWLDASDTTTITASSGSVSQWNDKSGNGLNFTQSSGTSQPKTGTRTLNGLNVLDFDGSNDFMVGGDILDVLTGGVTMVGVAKLDTAAAAGMWGKAKTGSQVGRYWVSTDGTSFNANFQDTATRTAASDPGAGNRTNTFIHGHRVVRASNITLWRNGSIVATTSTLSGTTSYNTTDIWMLGAFQNSTGTGPAVGTYMDGYIAELVVFLRDLSDAEMGLVNNYLNAKWAVH